MNIRVVISIFFATAFSASAFDDLTVMSDEFDDAGSLVHWSRIYQTEGWNNNVLEVFDANTTRPGHLVMTPHSSSWYEEWRGELTYKTVTGNFVVTTFVEPRNRAGTGRPESLYSLAGIMVRVPRAMTNVSQWTAGGQNYVFLSMGSAGLVNPGFEYEVKTTSNSVSTLHIEGTTATNATIQVARLNGHLIMLRRDGDGDWIVHRRYPRGDFPETLQAGLTVYTDWNLCSAVGVERQNLNVLTKGWFLDGYGTINSAQPDLTASFDYVRFARPIIPNELTDADFSNPDAVSDGELLAFLGDHANVPGGAAVEPEFMPGGRIEDQQLHVNVGVVSQRSYRVQFAAELNGAWSDLFPVISTGDVLAVEHVLDADWTQTFYRVVSP